MEIMMPYGKVTLDSKEEAAKFIRNSCNNCGYNTLINPCSGMLSMKCNKKKQDVVNYFKEHDK